MALGANGQNFILGKLNNAATKVTGLVGNVDGAATLRVTNPNTGTNDTALDLRVQAGEAPMRVNSNTRVDNLNADKLDGKDAGQIGVIGVERHALASANDSISPKRASVKCPEGTILVSNSGYVVGGYTGSSPNGETDVSLVSLDAFAGEAVATAWENDPTTANWTVVAVAQCASRP